MRLRLLTIAAFLTLAGGSLAEAQPPTLDALLAEFRAVEGVEARFVEEKQIALLALPVRSSGRIWFAPPDRLMRRVTAPETSAALITEGRLRMRQGGRTEDLSIDDNPVLRGFVDSFRAVLAGDRAALERFYRVTLTPRGGEAGWIIALLPRTRALRRFLRSIHIEGSGTTIERMTMIETNGDRTQTEFSDVNTARTFTAAERGRIFRID